MESVTLEAPKGLSFVYIPQIASEPPKRQRKPARLGCRAVYIVLSQAALGCEPHKLLRVPADRHRATGH